MASPGGDDALDEPAWSPKDLPSQSPPLAQSTSWRDLHGVQQSSPPHRCRRPHMFVCTYMMNNSPRRKNSNMTPSLTPRPTLHSLCVAAPLDHPLVCTLFPTQYVCCPTPLASFFSSSSAWIKFSFVRGLVWWVLLGIFWFPVNDE